MATSQLNPFPSIFSLRGRVALVTGAAQGLGFEIARIFGQAGAAVVIASRDLTRAEHAAERLGADGFDVSSVHFDVDDAAASARAIDQIVRERGGLDILVNNAAIRDRLPINEISEDLFGRILQTNLAAPFRLSKSAAEHMAARGWGRIIMITSTAGFRGFSPAAAYGASKGGLAALMRVFATTYARRGVTCNAIAPGGFATEFNAPSLADPVLRRAVEERNPSGRVGRPEEIAGAALFLASEAGSYVNGHELVVDGGQTIVA